MTIVDKYISKFNIYIVKNTGAKINIEKILCIQNYILTVILFLTNIYYAKVYHLCKISFALPYKYYYYKSKNEEYYMLEFCYYLTFIIWIYLFLDINYINFKIIGEYIKIYFNLDDDYNIVYYLDYYNIINYMYKCCFLYSTTILTLASFVNNDRFNINKLIYNLTNAIHIDNGFLFLVIQYYNNNNNINYYPNFNDFLNCIILYIYWVINYIIIMSVNLSLNNPKVNTISNGFNSNLLQYIYYHILCCFISLLISWFMFYSFSLQLIVFLISYINVSICSGLYN